MFIPKTATVLILMCFDVVSEMTSVFVDCSCKSYAVVAVARSSCMVVVCFSELRRMSCANLRLERFVSGLCLTSLTPWLNLFHFSVNGFRDVSYE